MGDQEVDIISIVSPITKYAKSIKDKDDILYELEKAIFIATQGRPGPVWIDLPVNIQGAQVDLDVLKKFTSNSFDYSNEIALLPNKENLPPQIEILINKIKEAEITMEI